MATNPGVPAATDAGTAALPALEVPDLPPRPAAGDVVRRALAASTRRLIDSDPVVRLGEDPEGVHQARVATRRLRSDLRTFAPLVDATWAEHLRTELSELAASLGAVRDADVLLMRLREHAQELQDEDRPAIGRVLRRLQGHGDAARTSLLAAMDGARYATLLDDLVDAVQHPMLTPAARHAADRELAGIAARPWRRLRSAVAALPDPPADSDLHRIRIAAKRARYAAEAVSGVVPDAAVFAKEMARLQSVLGEHHDAVIAEQWLRTTPLQSKQEAFAAGALARVEREHAEAARAQWPAAWARASHKRLRGWM